MTRRSRCPSSAPISSSPTSRCEIAPEDRERTGIEHPAPEHLYVTVRATPNPLDITANLRAPLVIADGKGYQVINTNEDAELQAPLFTLPMQTQIAS